VYPQRRLAIKPLVDQPAKHWVVSLVILALLMSTAVQCVRPARAAESPLQFLDDETLTVKYEPGEKAASTTLLLRNDGEDAIEGLRFSARVQDSAAEPRDGKVHIGLADQQDASIDGHLVERVNLEVSVDESEGAETYSGHLVAEAEGIAPATRPLKVVPVRLPPLGAGWLIYPTLLAAAVLVGIRTFTLPGSPGLLDRPMGPVDWDFGKSWASTLTTVGALLGTVLSAGVLPGDTQSLSKPAYAALNLFFGMLILIAGFVYTATRRPKETTNTSGVKQVQYQGHVWSFLLASFVTLWAVLGELVTLWFLLTEIGVQGTLSRGPLHIFQGVLLLAGLLALFYAWRSIAQIVKTQTDLETQKTQLQTQLRGLALPNVPARNELEPELPTWSLL
jgi:hypothetical protein